MTVNALCTIYSVCQPRSHRYAVVDEARDAWIVVVEMATNLKFRMLVQNRCTPSGKKVSRWRLAEPDRRPWREQQKIATYLLSILQSICGQVGRQPRRSSFLKIAETGKYFADILVLTFAGLSSSVSGCDGGKVPTIFTGQSAGVGRRERRVSNI